VRVKSPICLGVLLSVTAAGAFGVELPNYDESATAKRPVHASTAAASHEASLKSSGLVRPGSEVRMEERFGLPTFLWAAPPWPEIAASLSRGGITAEEAARLHLAEYAPMYGLESGESRTLKLDHVHDTGRGAIIATFRQEIGGIEVFRDRMRLAMSRDMSLIAISGYLPSAEDAVVSAASFAVPQGEALAVALKDLTGEPLSGSHLKDSGERLGTWEHYELTGHAGEIALVNPARIRKVLFHLPGRLEPGWHLELNAQAGESTDADYYSYVISAADGRMMFRMNLTVSDSFSYRAWAQSGGRHIPSDGPQGDDPTPHPTGLPDGYQAPFVAPSLITLQNGPISTNDPWLAPGATQTTGNNVDAYADVASPDGFTAGDFRADVTSPGVFDRIYDTSLTPQSSQAQQKASVTQLFYDTNFLHDWFYDAGFNESAGNGQVNNFGRGGLGNDPVRAEAQDYAGRNSANMATPSDGARPRMQLYLEDGVEPRYIDITPPGSRLQTSQAAFGPQVFDITAEVVLADDGAAPNINDGCQALTNNVVGLIALVDRGNCTFTVQAANAQNAGAVGVIVLNDRPGLSAMGGTAPTISIGSLMITQSDGGALKSSLQSDTVAAHMLREAGLDRDNTIDNQVVAHEWGHFISNRLIGNAGGLSTHMSRGLGEGWADFHALLMTVRPEDTLNPTNTTFNGVYSMAGYVSSGGVNNGYYFGIRRVPYSTDFARDPLAFRHIGNGQIITGAPISRDADGTNNAQTHNTGEVWATMLWECYAALLRDTLGSTPRLTFQQAQDRMRQYLVAGYKLTPSSPTLLEARDAILAAAAAGDLVDYEKFWIAFARRGAGLGAVGPDRFSSTNTPVTESYVVGGGLVFEGASLDDSVVTCDADGILDNGDTGLLTVTLWNHGTSSLSATTATISSGSPGVSLPQGGGISFPSSTPNGSTTASVQVALTGAAPHQVIAFNIAFSDPGLAVPGPINATAAFRVQTDEIPSATDTVEAQTLRWTPGSNPAQDTTQGWSRIELSPSDHRLLGPDSPRETDKFLVSPALSVAASGAFSFTFRHRHAFEFTTEPTYFDGGVIELSNNGGSSWVDIGASASPGYGGVLAAGGQNPLQGRSAYVGSSTAYPGFNTVTVNLGMTYAGQSVRIRFRIGTDVIVGAPGWEVDDIVFNSLTNLPFDALVPDRHMCVVVDSDGDGILDPSDCAPLNSTVWAAPSAARDLTLTDPGTSLSWQAPSSPGGTSPHYDVLRGAVASDFSGALCLETGGPGLSAADPGIPGTVYFYLVRAGNVCGTTLGNDSSSAPRTGAVCP